MPFSQKQIEILKYPKLEDFNILSGVTGSAKSYAANIRFYYEIITAPRNSTFIISGNTSLSLYDNVIKPLLEIDSGS